MHLFDHKFYTTPKKPQTFSSATQLTTTAVVLLDTAFLQHSPANEISFWTPGPKYTNIHLKKANSSIFKNNEMIWKYNF